VVKSSRPSAGNGGCGEVRKFGRVSERGLAKLALCEKGQGNVFGGTQKNRDDWGRNEQLWS